VVDDFESALWIGGFAVALLLLLYIGWSLGRTGRGHPMDDSPGGDFFDSSSGHHGDSSSGHEDGHGGDAE
jgi:hypothetical protein